MTDETAKKMLALPNDTRVGYESYRCDNCDDLHDPNRFNLTDLKTMARLWLMKDEIVETMKNNWDYDHSDPGGEFALEPLLAKLRALETGER